MVVSREFIENNENLTVGSVLDEVKNGGEWRVKKTVSDDAVQIDLRKVHKFDADYSSEKIIIDYSNNMINPESEIISLTEANDFLRIDDENSFNGTANEYQKIVYHVGDLKDLFEKWYLFFTHISKNTRRFPFSTLLRLNEIHNVVNLHDSDKDKTLGNVLDDAKSIKKEKFDYIELVREFFVKHNGEFIISESSIYKISLTEEEIKNINEAETVTLIQYTFFHISSYCSIKRVKRNVNLYYFYTSKANILNEPFDFDVEESFEELKYLINKMTEKI